MPKKSKLLKIKNVVNNEDDETPFAGMHNNLYANWMGTNLSGAFDKIAEWKLDNIIYGSTQHPNHSQNYTVPHSFLCYALPELTGVSFSYISANNYGDYMSYIFDPNYPRNPNTVAQEDVKENPNTPFCGLKAMAWSCKKAVLNPETLEEEKKDTAINENNILYAVISYKTKANLALFEKPMPHAPDAPPLKTKFDFAMNMDYSTKALDGNDYGEMYLCAEKNNEIIFFCKVQEGIIILNWATTEYKGDRKKVGSLRGKMAEAQDFINQLAEKEIISWKDESLFA